MSSPPQLPEFEQQQIATSPTLTIKDIDATAALTKDVNRDCDAVVRNAPPGFQSLLWSLSSLPHVLDILHYEATDPRSPLLKPENQWMGIAVEMLAKLNLTLREIQARAQKYRNLGNSSGTERQQIWDKIENSTEGSSISTLREEVCVCSSHFPFSQVLINT